MRDDVVAFRERRRLPLCDIDDGLRWKGRKNAYVKWASSQEKWNRVDINIASGVVVPALCLEYCHRIYNSRDRSLSCALDILIYPTDLCKFRLTWNPNSFWRRITSSKNLIFQLKPLITGRTLNRTNCCCEATAIAVVSINGVSVDLSYASNAVNALPKFGCVRVSVFLFKEITGKAVKKVQNFFEIIGSMEIDPPHESDGSTNGSKVSEPIFVSDNHSGVGLPFAPEDFPKPGDKWGWKVGKRVTCSGHFVDRYLYLPNRLYIEYKSAYPTSTANSRGFASKAAVKRFLLEAFPEMDIKAFFASFTWKIPSGKVEGNTDFVSICIPKFDPAGCKAGNINCFSLHETNDSDRSNIMACDICCIEPLFCRDCCCILCSKTVNSANGDHTFIKCEAMVKDGFICGHICHIECGLRSYMAGTVGGTIGLDAEYYCRRCDATTDLVPHVKNLLSSCESISNGDKMQKLLNICVIILRGSTKLSAKNLLHRVKSAIAKLKEGNSSEDIWKQEDMSAVTTGEVSQCETMEFETVTPSTQITFTNFDHGIESAELEKRVEKTLASLRKSQESEYRIAEHVLTTQKNRLLDLYQELKKEKIKLANCSPSTDPSLVHTVFKIMDQIKNEFEKISAMQGVRKGFGKTSKYVLKEHFGVHADN